MRPSVIPRSDTVTVYLDGDLCSHQRDPTVVAALGREVEALSIPIPANARVAELIPFDVLLPKADLFITNGGFGGTQQALAAGV